MLAAESSGSDDPEVLAMICEMEEIVSNMQMAAYNGKQYREHGQTEKEPRDAFEGSVPSTQQSAEGGR